MTYFALQQDYTNKRLELFNMIDPTVTELMKKVDGTYTLCNVVGKRARQLVDGALPLTGCKSKKPVSIAANEVNEGKVTYVRNKSDLTSR